jgi:SAM-dependent methyltransferase
MKKFFLHGPYEPIHDDNRMTSEGSVSEARERFLDTRFQNLEYLLRFRYAWMNEYLKKDTVIIEVGAGTGFSPLYLDQKPILTDATTDNPWIEKFIDATEMDLDDNSVDVIIASHNIHHFYSPYKFFKECERVLKKDGKILIQEINTSLMMRTLLRLMRHEGWSYDVDVFDPNAVVNHESDLWSANCAVPEMLFKRNSKFEEIFPAYKVTKNEPCECLIFPLSGGVISKTKMPKFPKFFLNFILLLDKSLVSILPNIFALGRRVVLERTG